MKKSYKLNDVIFIIFSLFSSIAFLFCLFIKEIFYAYQFLFFFLSLFSPLLIEFIFKIKVNLFIQITFYTYLILHFVLGEVFGFYITFEYYDSFLHFSTAVLLSIFGYSIMHYYLDDNLIFMQLLFAFLFSISCEFYWEILEFTIDHFFNTNMQRFIENGVILVGHDAIKDTIKDMLVATMGGLSIVFLSKITFIKKLKITIKKCL